MVCIDPKSEEPKELFKIGKDVFDFQLSPRGRYFALIRYKDTRGDGFVDLLGEDKADIYIVDILGDS